MSAGLICVVSVDVDREVDEGFNRWYDRHVAEVVRCPGWVRGTRYRCLDGEPRYMAVYEIERPELGAIGPLSAWTRPMQALQKAGYEEFWPHIEGYRARTYERILDLTAAEVNGR